MGGGVPCAPALSLGSPLLSPERSPLHGSLLRSPRLLSAQQMGRAAFGLELSLLEPATSRELLNLSFC